MANTLTSLSKDIFADKDKARSPSTYVSARLLAANTHEEMSVPTGATAVLLEVTSDTYVLFLTAAQVTAGILFAAVPTDLDDGSACERLGNSEGKYFLTAGYTKISFISAGTPIVTGSFYKA